MSASVVNVIGFLCLISSAVLMILNLKRVADMGTFWVALPLLLIGIVLVIRARKMR